MQSIILLKLIKPLKNLFKKLKRKDQNLSFHALTKCHKKLFPSFSCGDPELDGFLKNYALEEQNKNFSRVFLGLSSQNEIISFFSLSATSLNKADLPKTKRPPYKLAPVVLIGRLAVDKKYQGKGFGKKTLIEIIDTYEKACQLIGSTALVVESYDDAIDFYKKYKFKVIGTKKINNRKITTLYLLTETIKKEFSKN